MEDADLDLAVEGRVGALGLRDSVRVFRLVVHRRCIVSLWIADENGRNSGLYGQRR